MEYYITVHVVCECACVQRVVNTSFVQRASEQFLMCTVYMCVIHSRHMRPLNVRHCIRRTVTVCT